MINKKHVPCIAGSTGLVGSHLLKNLSNLYPKVISLTREEVNYSNPNIQNVIVNFDDLNIDNIRHKIKIYDCENIGISYGQFFTAIFKDLDFDYHIFIEDDYFPYIDYFDENLIVLLDSFKDDTFLCSFIKQNKTNIFNLIKLLKDSISTKPLINYFNKYNLTNFDIFLPDFSLGIISKKGVEKLIKTYSNIDNILELYKIKFSEIWVYQILFGYTFIIAGIAMKDYNNIYLNIRTHISYE